MFANPHIPRHSAAATPPAGAGAVRRRLLALALTAALLAPLFAACSSGSPRSSGQPSSSPSPTAIAAHRPFFPECGGASDQTITELTGVAALVTTARSSVGCQWLAGGDSRGPRFSFNWYRGSPIGRERKAEELGGAGVNDINIDGHYGFVAFHPTLGNYYCDVAIQYQDDFVEWSIRFPEKPVRDPCDIAKELSRQSIAVAKWPDR
jgi:Protein of unknown function (DUF3558)